MPTYVLIPIHTVPATFAPTDIWAKSEIQASCSTTDEELIIQCIPICAPLLITAFAMTTVPSSIFTSIQLSCAEG